MELIKLNQRIELMKSNQIMGLINLGQDIQSWYLARCSIITDGVKLNHDRQDTH